jgi:chemotaxis family two-component system response regulator Rcp1
MNLEMPPRTAVILLAEDNPTDVMLTREALANSGLLHTLHVVENGVEVMAFLRQQNKHAGAPRPDMILLDLNMPRKDGLEVLTEIKADVKLGNIPVIILTTSSSGDDTIKTYTSHANCYIRKTADFDDFTQAIQSVLDFWFWSVTLPMPSEH